MAQNYKQSLRDQLIEDSKEESKSDEQVAIKDPEQIKLERWNDDENIRWDKLDGKMKKLWCCRRKPKKDFEIASDLAFYKKYTFERTIKGQTDSKMAYFSQKKQS